MRCRTGPLKALPLPRRAEPDVWITVLDIADIPRAFGEINGIAVAVLREIGSVDVSEGFHRHVIAADPARSFEGRHLQPGIDLVLDRKSNRRTPVPNAQLVCRL